MLSVFALGRHGWIGVLLTVGRVTWWWLGWLSAVRLRGVVGDARRTRRGALWSGRRELVRFVDICAPEAEQSTGQAVQRYHSKGWLFFTGRRNRNGGAWNAASA